MRKGFDRLSPNGHLGRAAHKLRQAQPERLGVVMRRGFDKLSPTGHRGSAAHKLRQVQPERMAVVPKLRQAQPERLTGEEERLRQAHPKRPKEIQNNSC